MSYHVQNQKRNKITYQLVLIKITTFFNHTIQSYYDLFLFHLKNIIV